MAEFLARRVLAIRRVSRRALVIAASSTAAAAAAAGVALATTSGHGGAASSPGAGSAATAPVVRTDLISTTQVGGSIGFGGSYAIAARSGATAQQADQAQQAVAEDQQALSADKQAESDAAASGDQSVAAAEASVSAASAALSADQSAASADCAGAAASSAACSQDTQKVSQDQVQLTQARQQLAAAESTAKQQDDQSQAKVASDQTRLQGDQTALASLQVTAINPGTTYTWLPQPGQIISQDQPVYAVSNAPVPLLYGSIPAYRAFYPGMTDGADVGQLTHDLIALGDGPGLAQSDHYSAATVAAVERWQTALGLPATGQILLGEIVFEPGPIRVTSVTPSVGASTGGTSGGGGGVVLTATGTTPIVTIGLDVSQEYLVKPGDTVSVVLPNGTAAGGKIETVGTVASCPGGGTTGTGAGNGGGSAGQSPCSSTGSSGSGGSNSSATVTVTITLNSTPQGASLDQAPVNVNITTQRADNVLAVPVNALLALAGGGYAVQVVTGGSSHLVAVTTGLYSNTMVQVSGAGISAGLRVEVPSS